ncbi:hypothetical protein [Zoogloea sp.]|uniref:hypothetical protein n=1 Tax=Zoogloea sp. TaxID=49181 RepID=UPI0035AF2E41
MSNALYEPFFIKNTTDCHVKGQADYSLPAFCNTDFFEIGPQGEFSAKARGACLLRSVSAQVTLHDGRVLEAKEFTSAGTGLSRFVVIKVAEAEYMVTLLND